MMPAAPKPATALPPMNTEDECASAHINEPISRKRRDRRNIVLDEKVE